jgi:hypothetical protein
MASGRAGVYNESVGILPAISLRIADHAMSKVLTAVAAFFFLGGLALTVGYVAHQAVQWQLTRTLDLEHLEYFYLGAAAASIGMVTLALLEIRLAILMTIDHDDPSPQSQAENQQTAPRPRAKHSWKKSADIQRSFLGPKDP